MKKFNYPSERVFSFTDAVFSIAITILVLDIKVPSRQTIDSIGGVDALRYLIPSLIGFLVSFLVIALYWKFYLTYSRYINHFDGKLFWYNLFFLLFVVLLPFSTAFFVDNFFGETSFAFYCFNLIMLSLFNFFILNIVVNRAKVKIDTITKNWLRFRAVTTILVWVIALILSFWFPIYARVFFVFIFVFQFFGKIYFKRKEKRKLNME